MKLEKYENIREQIKSGDLLEWRTKSVFGWIIRRFTKKKVNHTSICLALPQYAIWTIPHKFIVEANPHGVELQLISRRLSEYKGEVWWSKLQDRFNAKRLALEGFSLAQVGIGYDYKGLFRNAASRVSMDARKYFCSELVGDAYRTAGVVSVKKALRPGEFKALGIHEPAVKIL